MVAKGAAEWRLRLRPVTRDSSDPALGAGRGAGPALSLSACLGRMFLSTTFSSFN